MKLKIDGLDCVNCAMNLEAQLKKDDRLDNVSVNFVNKSITLDIIKDISIDELKEKIVYIEPDVIFVEDDIKKYTYHLSGLDCASCADDFQRKLNDAKEIDSAIVNFAQEKLVVEYNEKDFNVIKKIADSMDDEIVVEKNKVVRESHINYEILISFVISALLVLSTYLIDFNDNIRMGILLVAYLVAGYDVLIKLVKNLLKRQLFDENFLMGVATIAAFGIGEHVEAVAVMLFYKFGEFFQDMAVNQSRKSISNLMDIQAEYANIEIDGQLVQVNPEELKVDDIIIVKPGEKVPVDGILIKGDSYLDTKALTGESKPVKAKLNSDILSGSINLDGLISIKVTKEFNDSTVAKILDLVENSSINKAPTENFITKFARIYTPIVVLVAALVAIVPPLLLNQEFYPWIYRALIFLVISCPCALVISVPLGFFGGIGNASRNGILIKGANYLEALNSVETVVFDKTGTLTYGDFAIGEVVTYNGISQDQLIEYAAYAESYSNHPIATSIKNSYNDNIDLTRLSEYQEVAGQGIKVKLDGKLIYAGNNLLMENNKIEYTPIKESGTIVYIALDNIYLGYISVEDQIKKDTISGLAQLKELGVKNLIMLTGDNDVVAGKVANKVGITKYYAKLLPQDKVAQFEILEQEKTPNKNIIFVGDGINDAPVLARADIGVAMGGVGSDAAIESADVVIMNDEISKIAKAIQIAKKTRRIVKQNIALALIVKGIALTLGVLGMAAIWQAIIADVGVAILAIFNSMRVLSNKK